MDPMILAGIAVSILLNSLKNTANKAKLKDAMFKVFTVIVNVYPEFLADVRAGR